MPRVTTIGVSIAIPEPWASGLQTYRTSIGDHTATRIPTHITLVPPTEVDDLDVVERHLRRAADGHPAFDVHLRGTGTFRPLSPVVFVVVVDGISACEQLAAACRSGPLTRELEFPYHPHVTIAHHLDEPVLDQAFDELAGFECRFVVEEFHLYVHDDDLGWQVDRTVALQSATVMT